MVAIYLDGASLQDMECYAGKVQGFTTNPSLMKKAGMCDYRSFARDVLKIAAGKPVSFEVLADSFDEMEMQAREISSWGENIYVKIPITNTKGKPSTHLMHCLRDLRLNVTAVMTPFQCPLALDWLSGKDILSVFVGRVTDTGRSAMSALAPALGYQKHSDTKAKILWASARDVYNYYQAEEYGVDIITLSPAMIEKLKLRNKSLSEYSLETVKQFHADGKGIEL